MYITVEPLYSGHSEILIWISRKCQVSLLGDPMVALVYKITSEMRKPL